MEQRNLARAALVRIGKQFGLGYAVKSAQDYMGSTENESLADSKKVVSPDGFDPIA